MAAFLWRRHLLFLPTIALLVIGLVAGIVQSLRFDSHLPRIQLDYGWYLSELRARGDDAGFVRGMQVAMAIDDGLEPAGGEKLLGGAYSDDKRYVEASHHYRRATELNPLDAEAQLLLGTSLLQLNRYAEAIAPLSRARDLQPAAPEIRLNLGLALVQSQHTAEAVLEFEELVRLQPTASNHAVLAMALHGSGRRQEAAAHCQEALRLEPDNTRLQQQCEQMQQMQRSRP